MLRRGDSLAGRRTHYCRLEGEKHSMLQEFSTGNWNKRLFELQSVSRNRRPGTTMATGMHVQAVLGLGRRRKSARFSSKAENARRLNQ